jgi:CBS-domain-containing membrane protein
MGGGSVRAAALSFRHVASMKQSPDVIARAARAAFHGLNPVVRSVIAGATGAAIAIGLMELLAERTAIPLLFVPFATSIVLVMGSPEIEAAQPRALVGGHLVATLVGLIVVKVIGPSTAAAALAVGLAMVAMYLTRSFHPPAGIDPLVVVVNGMSWSFLLMPVAVGAALLAAFAFVWHNLFQRGAWPRRWW